MKNLTQLNYAASMLRIQQLLGGSVNFTQNDYLLTNNSRFIEFKALNEDWVFDAVEQCYVHSSKFDYNKQTYR